MRPSLLLLAAAAALTAPHPPALAQGTDSRDILSLPAGLVVRDAPLADALAALQQRSGVSIAFSPDLLPAGRRVDCDCAETSVEAALRRILRGTPLVFEATRTMVRIVPAPAAAPGVQSVGTLAGTIRDAHDGSPLPGGTVTLSGGRSVLSGPDGRFLLVGIPAGSYDVTISLLGWETNTLEGVEIRNGETTVLEVTLERVVIPLREIVVAPSAFGLLREDPVPGRALTRGEVEAAPHMGSDLLRAMNRIPGVATHDLSAKPKVRGAPDDQVLVLLDGLELYEPYHMKYWDGVLSVVDPQAVGGVELFTGGFGAEYGDRLAGVMDIRSASPAPGGRTALGASVTNLTFENSGTYAGERGNWLVLARRGFLEYAFAVTGTAEGQELEPTYWDVFAKSSFQVAPGHLLTAHLLRTGEELRAVEEDSTLIRGRYGSGYGWLTWSAALRPSLSVETLVSAAFVEGDRRGEDDVGEVENTVVRDQRSLGVLGLSQRWSWQPRGDFLLRWGGDLKAGEAEHSYYRRVARGRPNLLESTSVPWSLELDRVAVTASPSGREGSLFATGRARLGGGLTAEAGVRWDRVEHTGDSDVSPRLGLAWEVSPATALRGAWGYYHQSQDLHELATADGDTTFYPAPRAEHRVLGIEHRRPGGTAFRAEAYQRLVADPRPEYRSLISRVEGMWEELLFDRVRVAPTRTRAQGVELSGRGPLGRRVTWAASYALAASEDRLEGAWVPRPLEQRHTLHLELTAHPTPDLSLALAWSYHSSWPYTDQVFTLAALMNGNGSTVMVPSFGPLYGEGMPAYHRLDARVAKRWSLPRGSLSAYLDLFNAYDRENALTVRKYAWWIAEENRQEILRELEPQLGLLPTLGLRWEF